MKILHRIKKFISRFENTEIIDKGFTFPYSSDKEIKRQQIWNNLQKGLLFEDKQTLIPWLTSFNQVDNFKEKCEDSGDRTEWYLGRRTVLGGYDGHFEIMKWDYLPWSNPFERVTSNLGYGKDGHHNFLLLIEHLKNLLGNPTKTDIEFESENFTEGSYEWKNGEVQIMVSGFDMHGSRYQLSIGLVRDRNEEHLNKIIENIKARGFTEEELGK